MVDKPCKDSPTLCRCKQVEFSTNTIYRHIYWNTDRLVLPTGKDNIVNFWLEHLQTFFSANCIILEAAFNNIPQLAKIMELGKVTALWETVNGIKQPKCGIQVLMALLQRSANIMVLLWSAMNLSAFDNRNNKLRTSRMQSS